MRMKKQVARVAKRIARRKRNKRRDPQHGRAYQAKGERLRRWRRTVFSRKERNPNSNLGIAKVTQIVDSKTRRRDELGYRALILWGRVDLVPCGVISPMRPKCPRLVAAGRQCMGLHHRCDLFGLSLFLLFLLCSCFLDAFYYVLFRVGYSLLYLICIAYGIAHTHHSTILGVRQWSCLAQSSARRAR